MTENEMMRIVNLEICEPFSESNPPLYYHPYFSKDILVVLGYSGGIVIWPFYSTNRLCFRRIEEHEGNYWLECDGPKEKDAIYLWDEYKVLETAMGWVKKHATHIFSEKTDEIVEFNLPWQIDPEENG